MSWDPHTPGFVSKSSPLAPSAPLPPSPRELVIEGYASVFDEPDLSGDIVRRGAFALSLCKGAQPVAMLFQHDPSEAIGVWDAAYEDRHGLFVRGRIHDRGPRARAAQGLVRRGLVDGLSIGFQTKSARQLAENRRELNDIQLWEVSVVTFPMAPRARLAVVPGVVPGVVSASVPVAA